MSDVLTPASQSQTVNVIGGIIAMMIVGLLWFISYALIFKEIPSNNQTNLATIIGLIGLQVGIIIGWYFRGSQNETQQSKTIALQADTAAKAQAALSPLASPVAATVSTPEVKVPLKAGETASVTAGPVPQTTPK